MLFRSTIGFNFYNRLLEQAIKNIQEKNPNGIWDEEERNDIRKIEIESDFYFPFDYISDEKEKISIYKRMLAFKDNQEFDNLKDELTDRFGNIPPLAMRAIDYYRLRMNSIQIGLSSYQIKGNFIICEFDKNNLPDKAKLTQIIPHIDHPVKFDMAKADSMKMIIDLSDAGFDKEKKLAFGEKIVKLFAS